MRIKEEVSITNAESALWQMVCCAIEGAYKEKWQTKEGIDELYKAYQEELNHTANAAFNMGRDYEAKKK